MLRAHCEICGMPDYVECAYAKHKKYADKKRQQEIAKEDPEDLLP